MMFDGSAEGCELLSVFVDGVAVGTFGYALERVDYLEHPRSDDVMLFGVVHGSAEDAVGGPVGAFPLGHAGEDFGRRGWRCGVAVGVSGVGFADDVRVVGVSAAAEGGVELAAIHARA